MFWTYMLFETKLLLKNKKNWFVGLSLVLFFPFFFLHSSQTMPESREDHAYAEQDRNAEIANSFDETQQETPEGAEVYEHFDDQSTLVNFQVYYITRGYYEEYIEYGIELNESRLAVHELGNTGIPQHLVVPEEEVLQELAFLTYVQEHSLPPEIEPHSGSQFAVTALTAISGLVFYFTVLLFGGEILAAERRHDTVVKGLPVSFVKKITGKIALHFIQVMVFLGAGLLAGIGLASRENGAGSFLYPVVIYRNGTYEAVSTLSYIGYALLALSLTTLLVLVLSVLLNLLFKNMYANVLIGLGIFLLPELFLAMGVTAVFIHAVTFTDFAGVLSGDVAALLETVQLDFWTAGIWLTGLITALAAAIIILNKLTFYKQVFTDFFKAEEGNHNA